VPSPGQAAARTAIVDIGSNSIRLVVYGGPARVPAVLFNEKVMAGLGRDLPATGAIGADALDRGRAALARYAAVAREMGAGSVRTVATAAVRDASNGQVLIDHAADAGLTVETLTGEQEAMAAGMGVLSGIPDADGVVGDLGGGSLELVEVRGGRLGERTSLPLGTLRLAAMGQGLERRVGQALREAGWTGRGRGRPFYLVGGSWRALVKLDIAQSGYPLPVINHYRMKPAAVAAHAARLPQATKQEIRDRAGLSSGRAGALADAARLLAVVLDRLNCSETVASAYGLREGLLFQGLDGDTRALDPLIVTAREEGRVLGRFPEHGDLLARWAAPLFPREGGEDARLRHAACLLADTGWRANPEFRADRGLEVALHGNWPALDAAGRAMVAQALWTAMAGSTTVPDPLPRLAGGGELKRAAGWGFAIRLGQRLSGGVAGPLERTRLSLDGGAACLHLVAADRPLYGEAVEKRHAALAAALGARCTVASG